MQIKEKLAQFKDNVIGKIRRKSDGGTAVTQAAENGNGVQPKKKRKKGRKRLFLILLLLIVVVGGVVFWQIRSRKAQAASARSASSNTATVTRGSLVSELSSSGTISAKDTYSLTSLVEGDVLTADFEEGDQVEEGQILYQIDATSMESQLKSANSTLRRAISSYNEAVEDYEEAVEKYSNYTYKSTRTGFIKSLSIEEGDKVSNNTEIANIYNDQTMKLKVPFLSGEAMLIGAGNQATIVLADTGEELVGVVTAVSNMDETLDGGRLVRYVTLEVSNPGGLTTDHTATVIINGMVCSAEGSFEPVLDTAMQAVVLGNSSLEVEALLVHEGDYVTIDTPIFRIVADDVDDILEDFSDAVDSADNQVDSAQSSVDSVQETYDNYTITAPISGQVITKSIKAGDTIDRSGSTQTTLAVIYDLSELTFEMSIDELDISSVAVGQKVEVTADAFEDVEFTGTVTNISLESSQSNGVTNYPVTVTLDDNGDLLPGMNVDGVIILNEVEDTLLIPIDSLMRGNRVYVQDATVTESEGNVPAGFRSVEVEVGISNDDYVQIISGLEEGDVVYVSESSASTTTFQMGGMGGGPGGNMSGGGGGRP